MPRWFVILLYIGMGWLSLVMLPQVLHALSLLPVLLLVGAGLLFTIGAVFYALRWPNPFPRVFGFHEVFHLLVIGGTTTITAVIWLWIIPLQQV
jgi:hemolysin III